MASADAVTVRVSKDDTWDRIHNLCRAISLLAFARCAVDLNQLREMDPAIQKHLYGGLSRA